MTQTRMQRFGDRFVNFIVGKPIIATLLGLAVVAALVPGLSRIKANFTHTAFFYDDDPLIKRFEAFERQFSNDDALVLVVHSPDGIFDMASAKLLTALTEEMWRLPDVKRVESLANYNWVHSVDGDMMVEPLLPDNPTQEVLNERKKVALEHEVLPDFLISRDGKTAVLYARVAPGFENPTEAPIIANAARRMLRQFQKHGAIKERTIFSGGEVSIQKLELEDDKELAKAAQAHVFHLTGGVAINTAFKESSSSDLQKLLPALLLITIIILAVRFRSVYGVVLPLVVVFLGLLAALGVAGFVGVELSTITITIPQIIIAVGVADAVHIITSYFLSRRRGLDKKQATNHALRKNLQPTILTSISTAIGFLAFATASLKPIAGLGVLAAAGTLVAWVATYFVLGGLLSLIGWRVKVATGQQDSAQEGPLHELRATTPAGKSRSRSPAENFGPSSTRAQSYTRWLYRRRVPIVIGSLILAAASVVISFRNTVNSDPFKYFSKDYPVRKAQDFVLNNLGGVLNYEIAVHSGKEDGIKSPEFLGKLQAFEKRVLALDGTRKVISIVEILKQSHRSIFDDDQAYYRVPTGQEQIAQLLFLYTSNLPQGMDINDRIASKYDSTRVSVISNITESSKWMTTRDAIESIGKELNLNVEVTGKALLYQGMNDHVVQSFIRSFVTAVFCISLLLIIVFRSVKVGLVALLPNLLPLFFGGLILYVLQKPIDIGTVLVASVCLGIAVDDTIHVLSNFFSLRRSGVSAQDAIAKIISYTAPALIITTTVLVAAFGSFAFGTFIPNVYFGVLTASILLTALIIDLTFLPAFLLIMDKDESLPPDSQ